MNNDEKSILVSLTSEIVSAHVSHNRVAGDALPSLIANVFSALARLGKRHEPEEVRPKPAVSVRASIKPDYLVCLEDGRKVTMLKRYLRTNYKMTPEEYRARWGLPSDYPMVAPNYAEKRRNIARSVGLGRKDLGSREVAAGQPD